MSIHCITTYLARYAFLIFLLFVFSYECGYDALCPDCNPTWATCQYCDEIYCEVCDLECMNICDGEGCNKANCNQCTCENEESAACVVKCVVKCGTDDHGSFCFEEDHVYHSFCFDCRMEECKKDWEGSCEGCAKVLAPLLVKEVEELRGKMNT